MFRLNEHTDVTVKIDSLSVLKTSVNAVIVTVYVRNIAVDVVAGNISFKEHPQVD